MKNYVFIYYNEGSMEGADAATMDAVKQAWGVWFGELGGSLVDGGNPFNSNGMAVEASGVSDIENHPATGYSIVKADSMEAAVEMAKGCPMLKDGTEGAAVRVYETLPM
jgi:hypothetical protein